MATAVYSQGDVLLAFLVFSGDNLPRACDYLLFCPLFLLSKPGF